MRQVKIEYPRLTVGKSLTATAQVYSATGEWLYSCYLHWTQRAATLYNMRGDVLSVIEAPHAPVTCLAGHEMTRDLLGQAGLLR